MKLLCEYNIPRKYDEPRHQTVNILISQIFALLQAEWALVRAKMPKDLPGWTLSNSVDITPPISASNLGPINVMNLCVVTNSAQCPASYVDNIFKVSAEDIFRAWSLFCWWRTQNDQNQVFGRKTSN